MPARVGLQRQVRQLVMGPLLLRASIGSGTFLGVQAPTGCWRWGAVVLVAAAAAFCGGCDECSIGESRCSGNSVEECACGHSPLDRCTFYGVGTCGGETECRENVGGASCVLRGEQCPVRMYSRVPRFCDQGVLKQWAVISFASSCRQAASAGATRSLRRWLKCCSPKASTSAPIESTFHLHFV